MIQEHSISVQKTAHYYTIGTPSEKVKYFWLVTHGYGQLASQIIHKFEAFDHEEHLIVAPEALSRFYWKRPQVGATWMTKHHRLDEIADYTRYLKGIYTHFIEQLSPEVKIIFFGFSQGSQTQFRWILREQPHFHHFVIWAGMPPDDLEYLPYQAYLSDKKIHYILGDQDEFMNEHSKKWLHQFVKDQGLDFRFQDFEGTHRIDRKVLMEVFEANLK